MTKIFPNLVKEKDTQVQEAHRVPNKMNPKRPTTGHIIIEVANIKDKENLKSSMRKTVTYKGAPIRLSADFSTETMHARKNRH